MPTQKYKRTRRKVYKRKRKPMRRRKLRTGGFPNKLKTKLRYVETLTFDAGLGTYSQNIYRANSLFDPNKTLTGHQPSNFDKLATIYDRYTVLGAKVKVYYVPTATGSPGIPPTVVLAMSEEGDTIATAHAAGGINNILEQPEMSRNIFYVGDSRSNFKGLTRYFSAKKAFATSNLQASPYSADVTTNPTEIHHIEVAAISPDDSVNPAAVTLRIEIDYIALFSEPKLTDAS